MGSGVDSASGSVLKSIVCCSELMSGVAAVFPAAFRRSLLRFTRMRFVASAEVSRTRPRSTSTSSPGVLAPVFSPLPRRLVKSVAAYEVYAEGDLVGAPPSR